MIFGGSVDCVTLNSPQFLEIILQPAGQHPNSAAEHEKMLSGLKLTVQLQQPLCNAIGNDKVINMYHTYSFVIFFTQCNREKVAKQYTWHWIM